MIVPFGEPESLFPFRVHAPDVATVAGRPCREQPLNPTEAMLTLTPPVPVFVFPGDVGIVPVPVTLVHRSTTPPVVVKTMGTFTLGVTLVSTLVAVTVPPAGVMVVAAEASPVNASAKAAVDAATAMEREMKRDEVMVFPFMFLRQLMCFIRQPT
ncbi:hypothetical protein AB4Z09_09280 [Rhodococcus sp. TAF43]